MERPSPAPSENGGIGSASRPDHAPTSHTGGPPTVTSTATKTATTEPAGSAHAPVCGDDDDNASGLSSPSDISAAPLWWAPRHARVASEHSLLPPPTIALEDHSEEDHEQSRLCWAASVSVDEYVVVTGVTGAGAYVVWHCTVRTLHGGHVAIRRRYSEFDRLRTNLVRSFPHAEAMIPALPRKSIVSRFRPKFLEQRRTGLAHFLTCILLNPEFAASPILKEFIFS